MQLLPVSLAASTRRWGSPAFLGCGPESAVGLVYDCESGEAWRRVRDVCHPVTRLTAEPSCGGWGCCCFCCGAEEEDLEEPGLAVGGALFPVWCEGPDMEGGVVSTLVRVAAANPTGVAVAQWQLCTGVLRGRPYFLEGGSLPPWQVDALGLSGSGWAAAVVTRGGRQSVRAYQGPTVQWVRSLGDRAAAHTLVVLSAFAGTVLVVQWELVQAPVVYWLFQLRAGVRVVARAVLEQHLGHSATGSSAVLTAGGLEAVVALLPAPGEPAADVPLYAIHMVTGEVRWWVPAATARGACPPVKALVGATSEEVQVLGRDGGLYRLRAAGAPAAHICTPVCATADGRLVLPPPPPPSCG